MLYDASLYPILQGGLSLSPTPTLPRLQTSNH